ncbi:hypothetical protein BT67DRAFT_257440 [Trichocladium antarcticum]|uniref:Uncharacterized protein n=1 Tax=Trichocladium antarcticum TaxID=1450529 RepID=A0AAN6ZE21_9PEZI|nr:hypothetical protein BT67DRAFT_257440 [Trichocladium antarcticum]
MKSFLLVFAVTGFAGLWTTWLPGGCSRFVDSQKGASPRCLDPRALEGDARCRRMGNVADSAAVSSPRPSFFFQRSSSPPLITVPVS